MFPGTVFGWQPVIRGDHGAQPHRPKPPSAAENVQPRLALRDSGQTVKLLNHPADLRFHWWAQRDSNPRHLPCKMRKKSPTPLGKIHLSQRPALLVLGLSLPGTAGHAGQVSVVSGQKDVALRGTPASQGFGPTESGVGAAVIVSPKVTG